MLKFANDLAVFVQDELLDRAHAKVQRAVTAVEQWAVDNRMQVNPAKCEGAFFSTDPYQARFQTHFTINGQNIPHTASPKYPGIHLNRLLNFGSHTAVLIKKLKQRVHVLRAVAGKSRGVSKEVLRTTFKAYVESAVLYCTYCSSATPPLND